MQGTKDELIDFATRASMRSHLWNLFVSKAVEIPGTCSPIGRHRLLFVELLSLLMIGRAKIRLYASTCIDGMIASGAQTPTDSASVVSRTISRDRAPVGARSPLSRTTRIGPCLRNSSLS